MMRTIKQLGQGFNVANELTVITASIDGEPIHDGTIFSVDYDVTKDPSWPWLTKPLEQDELFSWKVEPKFEGTQTLRIHVKKGRLILTDTIANFITNREYEDGPPATIPQNPHEFGNFTWLEVDGVVVCDPFTDVYINGILQPSTHRDRQVGQRWWTLEQGDNFRCTVFVRRGLYIEEWSHLQPYGNHYWVQHQGQMYFSIFDMPAGVPLTDKRNWTPIPLPIWDPNQSYEQYSRVRYGDQGGFRAIKDVPAGILLNNTKYWHEWNPAPILEWDGNKIYAPPDRVRFDAGNGSKGYRSLKPVPVGIDITNTEYWESCTETECYCAEEEF